MRKHFSILALVMILCLAFLLPVEAIKIAPYSQPLHDIMHWDAKSAKLIIMNPEGETQTVAWPATVDLWNYNGNSWTFDLPTGDVFAFSKRVNVVTSTTEGAGSTVRSESITHTVGAAGAIHEALYVTLNTEFATGAWANAIVGVLNYGAAGSSSGGLGAAICAEVNMAPIASPGGSYYNVHSYFNAPASTELIDSTAFNYAFERYETADPDHEFDLYGLLWHIVGLDDNSTKVWYDNTLKIQIDTTKWWIPLSEAEGSYTTSYPIVSNMTTGAAIDLTAPATGIDIGIADHGIHFTGAVTPGDVTFSFIQVGDYTTALAVAPAGANMFGIVHNVSLTDIDVAFWYQAYYTKITTAGTTTATSIAGHALRINAATSLEAVYGIQCHTNITAGADYTQELISISTMVDMGDGDTTTDRVLAFQAMITGSGTAGTVTGLLQVASFVNAGTVIDTDAIIFVSNQTAATSDVAVEFDLDGTVSNVWEFNGDVCNAFTTADAGTEMGGFDEYVLIPVTVEGVTPQLYIMAAETWASVD